MPIRINLLNIGSDFATESGAHTKKRVIGRSRSISIKSQNHTREMRVVRSWSAECVVHHGWREKWPVRQILQPAPPALVSHKQVNFAVRPEPHHSAIMV